MTQAGRHSAPNGAAQPYPAAGAQPHAFGMGSAPVPGAQVPPNASYPPAGYVMPGTAAMPDPDVAPYPFPYPYAGQQPAQPAKKKRHAARWVLLVLLLLCIAVAVLLWLFGCGGASKRAGIAGQLDGKTPDEIQAELDRIVDEGMFNISIASTVQMERGDAPAELRIENVPGNRYLMRVVLVRDDTGEQLYETDLIEPNFHIQQDTLDVVLPAGTYPCTAMFYAYDMETEEQVGQAAARITVMVAS